MSNTCEICGHHGHHENDGIWIRKTDMNKFDLVSLTFHYVCFRCVDKFFDEITPPSKELMENSDDNTILDGELVSNCKILNDLCKKDSENIYNE